MKICLINPTNVNRDWGYSFPPLGIAYIAAKVLALGFEVFVFDRDLLLWKNNMDFKRVDELTEKMLREERPDFVGIGATTPLIFDTYKVARMVKKIVPLARVIAGGGHPTILSHQVMADCKEIDCVVVGEGEETFVNILLGNKAENILGILYRKGEDVVANPLPPPIKEMDSILFPARELLDMRSYTQKSKHLIRGVSLKGTSIFTTRGCPFLCSFCCAPLVFGRSVRYHSAGYVIAELEHLIERYKVEGIYFADDMFASNLARAHAICDEIIKRGINRKIVFAVQMKANAVDEDILLKLKKAGCIQVEYGFESGSQKMLDLMNKRVKIADNYKAAGLTRKVGLRILANLIVGMPGETKEDFAQTMRFLKKIKPDVAGLYKLVLLPGTKLYNDFEKQFSEAKNWDCSLVDDLNINLTDIPKSEFIALFKKAKAGISISNARAYILYNFKRNAFATIGEVLFLVINKVRSYIRKVKQCR